MKNAFEVVVAGAGIAGLTAALLLAGGHAGPKLRVTVVDAGRRPRFEPDAPIDLRVSAVSAGSVAVFERIGAWRGVLCERCWPFDHMRVWDAAGDAGGNATLRFDADEFAVAHLGYIVENRLLQHVLLDALDAIGTECAFETRIDSLDLAGERPVVELADASHRETDLVVAADGSDSLLRNLAGLPFQEHDYGQEAFVARFRTAVPHGDTAWQRFLPDGPLGVLPLGDAGVSVVWTTTPEQAAGLVSMQDDALGDALAAAADGVLGNFRVVGPRGRFPLVARHAAEYVRKGVALLGDAAHTVHPLAGQGANLGIADAVALTEVIRDALSRREYPADRPVLRRYERARKGQNALMMHFMTGLNRLFASDSALIGELRRSGMALFNQAGPVRATMARIALGEAGQR